MTIPHLKQRAEFYPLCFEHGEENVEWRCGNDGVWKRASHELPNWFSDSEYTFRLRPRAVVIPEAVVPEEDLRGNYMVRVSVEHIETGEVITIDDKTYLTHNDADIVLAAMMRREKR